MENTFIDPSLPNLVGLTWRSISRADLAAVVELARACLRVDGGLPFRFEPEVIQELYFPASPGTGLGAFDPPGRLAACAAVSLPGNPGAQRAVLVGQVHPDLRGKGIGGYLMRWSQAQALALLAASAAKPWVLQIATESLTGPADRLYRAHGFEQVFDSLAMRLDLRQPQPDLPLPPGVTLAEWQPDLAGQFFQAYNAAFRERLGFPGWSEAEWIAQVTENDHRPDWSLLARAGGEPVGFVIGNMDLTTSPIGGFIWQVGVVPAWRRRGLASALLVEAMRRMQAGGATPALLTVNANNPGAIEAYSRLGFIAIGRRARYRRTVEP